MHIVTIATQGEWLQVHARRWLRQVRRNVPGAKCCLILAQGGDAGREDAGAVALFDRVQTFPLSAATRPWFNYIRMMATTLFGVDEVLYLDADADVLSDLNEIPGLSDKRVLWVASPVMHGDWLNVCDAAGWDRPEKTANNCLLYLRGDFGTEYAEAVEYVAKCGVAVNPRIAGTVAFNVMLHEHPGLGAELPGEYGAIWWEGGKWLRAKVLQGCNDAGKEKRERLERLRGAVSDLVGPDGEFTVDGQIYRAGGW